jgi:hypothetical protein
MLIISYFNFFGEKLNKNKIFSDRKTYSDPLKLKTNPRKIILEETKKKIFKRGYF